MGTSPFSSGHISIPLRSPSGCSSPTQTSDKRIISSTIQPAGYLALPTTADLLTYLISLPSVFLSAKWGLFIAFTLGKITLVTTAITSFLFKSCFINGHETLHLCVWTWVHLHIWEGRVYAEVHVWKSETLGVSPCLLPLEAGSLFLLLFSAVYTGLSGP